MLYVRKIDENGLFIEDTFVDELSEFTIEIPCPEGFYLPKWDGDKWVEGGTKPETELQPPTPHERLTLLENAILDLMME